MLAVAGAFTLCAAIGLEPGAASATPEHCVVKKQSHGASICVTHYVGDRATFKLAGFRPRSHYQVDSDAGTVRGSGVGSGILRGDIGYDGTNTTPSRKPASGFDSTALKDGLTAGGTGFEVGFTVTGTSHSRAAVGFRITHP